MNKTLTDNSNYQTELPSLQIEMIQCYQYIQPKTFCLFEKQV